MKKLNINTESGKIKNVIRESNASKNILFFYKYRDFELMYVDILTVLSVFPIASINQIQELSRLHHKYVPNIYKLRQYGCIKIYLSTHPYYDIKKEMLPNFYEKGIIIESMDHIKDIYKGAVFDMPKFIKISLAQLRRKTKTPYSVNNKTIIVEMTDKGRLLLQKYIELYTKFFNVPEERFTINRDILGLFKKSVDELKPMVQKDDITQIMFRNADNRRAEKLEQSSM
jgi:hypothetical protein